jgi:hypothetical protein
MCACTSTKPGMIVLPAASTTFAPVGLSTLPVGPTDTTRLSVTTTSPFSMTSSAFIVTIRAPVSTIDPRGRARGASTTGVMDSGVSAPSA